jgi:hypothetical protein
VASGIGRWQECGDLGDIDGPGHLDDREKPGGQAADDILANGSNP